MMIRDHGCHFLVEAQLSNATVRAPAKPSTKPRRLLPGRTFSSDRGRHVISEAQAVCATVRAPAIAHMKPNLRMPGRTCFMNAVAICRVPAGHEGNATASEPRPRRT